MVSLSHNSDFGQEGVVGKYVLGLVLDIVVEVGRVVAFDIVVVVVIVEEGNY